MSRLSIVLWLLTLLSLLSFAVAQSFNVPSNWRKPTSPLSRADRLILLDGLLNTVTRTLNSSSGSFVGITNTQTANMLCALAIGDYVNGSATSKDVVLSSLNTRFTMFPDIIGSENPQVNSDRAIWGLAAICAYRAYRDRLLLQHAQTMWTLLSTYLVSSEDAASGTHPSGGMNISSTCNGASTAGAVFFIANDPNNLSVNGETTAAFMALSAHLYEQTSTPQYLAAAILSVTFIANNLYNGVIILDSINLGTCQTTDAFVTYNSGFTIDGLSILADVAPKSGSLDFASFLSNLIQTAVVYPHWTNSSDGIIIEGPRSQSDAEKNGFDVALKGILIRGLYQAYARLNSNRTDDSPSSSNSEADFIQSFITVQFNALLDLASTPESNQYSPRWEGPPSAQLLPWGQLAAMDVFVSAVGLAGSDGAVPGTNSDGGSMAGTRTLASPASSSAALTTGPDSDNSDSGDRRKLSGGAIAGIVIGLLAILAGMFAFIILWRKRARRKLERTEQTIKRVLSNPPSSRRDAQMSLDRGDRETLAGAQSESSYDGGNTRSNNEKKEVGYTVGRRSFISHSDFASLSGLVESLRRVVVPSEYEA
ncbi:hypothetical protein BDY19DRAFT_998712 [Irpex rosettiformis]|uniref:Uncharacterized protein n=1 Tax=Irpex rosettiformis TaxID=378272 RepID=A0ACB8TMQ3_9APHY|nr:hypothetical protein BDY19DRAFT_998712 [Irpex rosettiformis]